MKKTLTLLIIGVMMGIASALAIDMASNPQRQLVVTLKKLPTKNSIPPDELDAEGRRTPSKPTICIISEIGIEIGEFENSQIYLYEVYGSDGLFLASFNSESEFLSFLFQSFGELNIRFYTADYILQGWVDMY